MIMWESFGAPSALSMLFVSLVRCETGMMVMIALPVLILLILL